MRVHALAHSRISSRLRNGAADEPLRPDWRPKVQSTGDAAAKRPRRGAAEDEEEEDEDDDE